MFGGQSKGEECLALTHFLETGDAKSSARMLPASSHVLLRLMRVGCVVMIESRD